MCVQVRKIPETSAFTSRERQTMFKYTDDMSATIGASERIVQVPPPEPFFLSSTPQTLT